MEKPDTLQKIPRKIPKENEPILAVARLINSVHKFERTRTHKQCRLVESTPNKHQTHKRVPSSSRTHTHTHTHTHTNFVISETDSPTEILGASDSDAVASSRRVDCVLSGAVMR